MSFLVLHNKFNKARNNDQSQANKIAIKVPIMLLLKWHDKGRV